MDNEPESLDVSIGTRGASDDTSTTFSGSDQYHHLNRVLSPVPVSRVSWVTCSVV